MLPGKIVAVSESERLEARRFIFLKRIEVVANSIEVPDAVHDFRTQRVPGSRWKVGTCGRISPQKDPGYFAEFASGCQDIADFQWIGGGNYPLGYEQLNRASVVVTGVLGREEATMRIADLDVYVQTSAWEGLPIAVLEAMAIGIPVVVRDAVGNRDLIQGIEPDLIVDSPEEMSTRVRALCFDLDMRNEIGKKLKGAATRDYSAETQYAAFLRLYGLCC